MSKPLMYFLCTGNSCRSQIADGWLKALGSAQYEVKSAGLEAHGLNPRAVQVIMAQFREVRDTIKARIEYFLAEGK